MAAVILWWKLEKQSLKKSPDYLSKHNNTCKKTWLASAPSIVSHFKNPVNMHTHAKN